MHYNYIGVYVCMYVCKLCMYTVYTSSYQAVFEFITELRIKLFINMHSYHGCFTFYITYLYIVYMYVYICIGSIFNFVIGA